MCQRRKRPDDSCRLRCRHLIGLSSFPTLHFKLKHTTIGSMHGPKTALHAGMRWQGPRCILPTRGVGSGISFVPPPFCGWSCGVSFSINTHASWGSAEMIRHQAAIQPMMQGYTERRPHHGTCSELRRYCLTNMGYSGESANDISDAV